MCESLHVILKGKHDINENPIKTASVANLSSTSSCLTPFSSKRKAPLGLNKWELRVSFFENYKFKFFQIYFNWY